MSKTLYIGIDTGSNTGVAFWYPITKRLQVMQFVSHGAAMIYLHELLKDWDKSEVKFRIEDARLTMKFAKKLPRHLIPKQNKGKIQGVGAVKAYSKDWEIFCKNVGYDHELLPPGNTKVSPEYFEKLTGIKTLKTHSHERDAGMLVYGIK